MDAQRAAQITTLVVFFSAIASALYIAVQAWRATNTFKSQSSTTTLFTLGLWVLLIWALRDIWRYGLFGMAADPYLWLLGVPLYFLHRRLRRIPPNSSESSEVLDAGHSSQSQK